MEHSPDEIIGQANQLMTIFEYQRALDLYKRAIEILFRYLKSYTNPEDVEKTKLILDQLLKRAENCQRALFPDKYREDALMQMKEDRIQAARIASIASSINTSTPAYRSQPIPQAQTTQSNAQTTGFESMIENEIIDSSPGVNWDDIAGLESAKAMLQEVIVQPSLYPHLFTGIRAPPKGILLFGPPGTGKTMLAKAVASQCSATFLCITAADLTSKFYGEAEKLVRALFTVSRRKQPSVIFIDELDSILSSRSEGQNEASRRLETEFLVQMDGVNNSTDDRVVVIGATNRPQEIDEAVRRRFTKRVYVDLPNDPAREVLIRHQLRNIPHDLGVRGARDLVKMTEGYSGSDLSALCKEAAMFPVRGLSHAEMQEGRIPPVTIEHFRSALEVIRPSVGKKSLDFYRKWNDEYGSRSG